MINDDMLRNIEYLREKADVSYEEAGRLLETYDGNVMRVLVELERQGRVFQQGYEQPRTAGQTAGTATGSAKQTGKAASFIQKAFQHHLVVEKVNGDKRETVANLSAPYVAGAAVVAPHLAAASVALMFVCGYRVKIKKEKGKKVEMPDDVETFVDKTVSNIKRTASSLGETVRGEKDHQDDDNDEGGEITIE